MADEVILEGRAPAAIPALDLRPAADGASACPAANSHRPTPGAVPPERPAPGALPG